MTSAAGIQSELLASSKREELNKGHLKGTYVSLIACASMWLFALMAYLLNILKSHHLTGVSVAVLFLVVVNLATLNAINKNPQKRLFDNFFLVIVQLEIFGYTAIIYFCGDIEASYITLVYAVLIAYVGVIAQKSISFIVASLCAATYCLMFVLIHTGIIPHLNVFPGSSHSLKEQVVIILLVIGFLYTVAFISAASASLIKQNRVTLQRQNEELAAANNKLMHEIQLRIQAVDALQESEQQYRSILESAPDSITMIRISDGCYVQVNECFLQLTGYSRKEALGRTPFDLEIFFNSSDWEYLINILKEKGKINDLDIKLRSRTGKIIDTLFSARTLRYRGEDCLITIITDITNRKQAERELQESKNRYKTLTYNLNVGVYRTTSGSEAKFIEANPALVKMFLYQDRHEFLAPRVADLYQNPDDRKIFIEKLLKTGFVRNEELNLKRKDGSLFIGSVSSVVVKDKDGNVKYHDGIIEDVSERKRLESQIQQVEKMEAIGTLAGGIAHDFNNLLMAIQGNVSLMIYDLDSADRHYQYLRNIETSVTSGAKLTKQLLGYARKGKYQNKSINLNKLVKETLDTFGRTRKDITIHYELSEDLFAILADQGQMEQVLLNFYVNAADAMPTGGELFLKTGNRTHADIRDSLYEPESGSYVELVITDTGSGMDKKTQERIFEPFFTTKEMGRGTGLGLASVFGIIKGHGGYIDVKSQVRHGTTFKVYLPASGQTAVKATKSACRINNGNGTILLVDDEEIVLAAGSKILERLGYTVLEAKGGQEAVEVYEENRNKIDMVILDMIMPVMGGGEVFDKMKELDPNVRVLLSSGYSIDGQATEIMKRGCEDFLQKPFNVKKLSEKLNSFLS
ncbi:MAG: PAS domain S-box protein [Desulfobacterales bacterium]|nr:PAS domain S-box protein [Desulfobacterales bacterium]